MNVQPYLFFGGRAAEAIAFYEAAVGAETLALMRYSESPQPVPAEMLPPGGANAVMHACLRIGDAQIMIADGCAGQAGFAGFSLTVTSADPAESERLFSALADGGAVRMPLGETFFSPRFGMLVDQFGVPWTIVTEAAAAAKAA